MTVGPKIAPVVPVCAVPSIIYRSWRKFRLFEEKTMKNKLLKLCFGGLVALSLILAASQSHSLDLLGIFKKDNGQGIAKARSEEETRALRAVLALNYVHSSLQKIIDYNDKIVLEEQYSEIINNINLTKIDDEEVINLLEGLMNTLTKFQINEKDKEIFQQKYEKKMEAAFYEAFSNPGPIFAGDPLSAGISALVNIGSSYANYTQKQKQYQEELDSSMWEIKKDEKKELTSLRADFLRAYWSIMKRRSIPDKRRLTEKQLTAYIQTLKDNDKQRQFRKLERVSGNFLAYPPFWYYYGKVAQEIGDYKTALEAYETFQKIHQGFFREDSFYTSVLMNKIQLLDPIKDRVQIMGCLSEIQEYSPNDPRKRIFCALKYYQFGKYEEARKLLQANIDDDQIAKLSTKLLGEVYVAQKDKKNLEKIVGKMLAGDTYENYDLLYLLGQMPEKRMIDKIKDQILEIEVIVDEDLLWDDLILSMPLKWALEEPDKFKVSISYLDKSFEASDFEVDKDNRRINFYFTDSFDAKQFEKNNYQLPMKIKIDHPYHQLTVVGNLKKCKTEEEIGKLGKSYNKIKSLFVKKTKLKTVKTKEIIVFQKEYIETAKHKYVIKNNGDIKVL